MIDLDVLRERLLAALPQLSIGTVELEHTQTRVRLPALSIESEDRKPDHVYKMTIAVIDDAVHFFVHIHGKSGDLSTRGTQHYSKECVDVDEVFAIVLTCWVEGAPS